MLPESDDDATSCSDVDPELSSPKVSVLFNGAALKADKGDRQRLSAKEQEEQQELMGKLQWLLSNLSASGVLSNVTTTEKAVIVIDEDTPPSYSSLPGPLENVNGNKPPPDLFVNNLAVQEINTKSVRFEAYPAPGKRKHRSPKRPSGKTEMDKDSRDFFFEAYYIIPRSVSRIQENGELRITKPSTDDYMVIWVDVKKDYRSDGNLRQAVRKAKRAEETAGENNIEAFPKTARDVARLLAGYRKEHSGKVNWSLVVGNELRYTQDSRFKRNFSSNAYIVVLRGTPLPSANEQKARPGILVRPLVMNKSALSATHGRSRSDDSTTQKIAGDKEVEEDTKSHQRKSSAPARVESSPRPSSSGGPAPIFPKPQLSSLRLPKKERPKVVREGTSWGTWDAKGKGSERLEEVKKERIVERIVMGGRPLNPSSMNPSSSVPPPLTNRNSDPTPAIAAQYVQSKSSLPPSRIQTSYYRGALDPQNRQPADDWIPPIHGLDYASDVDSDSSSDDAGGGKTPNGFDSPSLPRRSIRERRSSTPAPRPRQLCIVSTKPLAEVDKNKEGVIGERDKKLENTSSGMKRMTRTDGAVVVQEWEASALPSSTSIPVQREERGDNLVTGEKLREKAKTQHDASSHHNNSMAKPEPGSMRISVPMARIQDVEDKVEAEFRLDDDEWDVEVESDDGSGPTLVGVDGSREAGEIHMSQREAEEMMKRFLGTFTRVT